MKKSHPKEYPIATCIGCGTCCTVPVVPVSDADVERLCTATGKRPGEIVRFYSSSEMQYDRDAELWIRFSKGKRAMGLRRRGGHCMFLSPQKRCMIYENRPRTCRSFPYQIYFDDKGKMESAEINPILKCKCTRAKGALPRKARLESYRELKDDESFYERIGIWNDLNPRGSPEDFFRFMGLEK